MEDTISTVGAALGYPVLGVALVMLWRLYVEVRKDRDFWRAEALGRARKVDVATDTAEGLVNQGKAVSERVAQVVRSPSVNRQEQLEQVVELLLRGATAEEAT